MEIILRDIPLKYVILVGIPLVLVGVYLLSLLAVVFTTFFGGTERIGSIADFKSECLVTGIQPSEYPYSGQYSSASELSGNFKIKYLSYEWSTCFEGEVPSNLNFSKIYSSTLPNPYYNLTNFSAESFCILNTHSEGIPCIVIYAKGSYSNGTSNSTCILQDIDCPPKEG